MEGHRIIYGYAPMIRSLVYRVFLSCVRFVYRPIITIMTATHIIKSDNFIEHSTLLALRNIHY